MGCQTTASLLCMSAVAWAAACATGAAAARQASSAFGSLSVVDSTMQVDHPRAHGATRLPGSHQEAFVLDHSAAAVAADDLAASKEARESIDSVDDVMFGTPRRSLLHGCHTARRGRCRNLPTCPRCLFPARNSVVGHCKRTTPDRIFNCARPRANGGLSGRSGGGGAGSAGADPPESRVPLPDSINPRGRRIDIGNIACPNLFTAEQLDAEQGIVADGEVMEGPATQEDGSSGSLTDVFVPPLFWAVSTPEELQEALLAGPTHILITAHLDMTTVQTNVMKPESKVAVGMKKIFTLKNAVGRLRNTTFSIAGQCEGPAPEHFYLTEPLPHGACAILVEEDFLDAPLGTSCVLLDSLYVAVAAPGPEASSVLLLQAEGVMWVVNSVFQGAGGNSRAIDTNSQDTGRPELYVRDTTFTSFTREFAPGIRILNNTSLWLDNVTFRDIAFVSPLPRKRRKSKLAFPQGTAVTALDNVLIILANVTFERNTVFGEPAGPRVVTVVAEDTELYSTMPIEVWQWPRGPALPVANSNSIAEVAIQSIARPELEVAQSLQREAVALGLRLSAAGGPAVAN